MDGRKVLSFEVSELEHNKSLQQLNISMYVICLTVTRMLIIYTYYADRSLIELSKQDIIIMKMGQVVMHYLRVR